MYYIWKYLQMQQINWDTPKWKNVANKLGRRKYIEMDKIVSPHNSIEKWPGIWYRSFFEAVLCLFIVTSFSERCI